MVAVLRCSWTASPCLGEHNSRWTPPLFLLCKLTDDRAASVQSETARPLTRQDVSRPARTQSSQALTGELGWSSLMRRQVVAGHRKPSISLTSCPKRKRGQSRASCATVCVMRTTTVGVRFWLAQRAAPSPSHCWSAARRWVLTGTFPPRLRWSPIAATCLCWFVGAGVLTDGCFPLLSREKQDDLFVNGVLTAQSCENLLHCDVEPNASSDIMIVSDIELPSKPSSKYIVTSHSLQPESSAQPSPTSDSILCTAHVLLETCCHMKAKLLILTIAYPGA